MLVGTTIFATLSIIDYQNWKSFYAAIVVTRFVMGYADSLILTTSVSLLGSYFSDQKAKYFGLMEAACGLGLIVGPPIGSLMYGYFGFEGAFMIFSGIILVNLVTCAIFLTSKLNLTQE